MSPLRESPWNESGALGPTLETSSPPTLLPRADPQPRLSRPGESVRHFSRSHRRRSPRRHPHSAHKAHPWGNPLPTPSPVTPSAPHPTGGPRRRRVQTGKLIWPGPCPLCSTSISAGPSGGGWLSLLCSTGSPSKDTRESP